MIAHPQKFRLLGRRISDRWWAGIEHMTEGVDYERVEPQIVDHLPAGEWFYNVIGAGFDYHDCTICFPNGHKAIDNLGQRKGGA